MDKLHELILSGTPVGFCPWLDGEGMLWGRVLDVTDTTFRVQQLDVFGQNEDIEEYDLTETLYFDVDPVYAERLAQLRNFNPTFPEETEPVMDGDEINDVFTRAFKSGEVIRITIPGTSDLDVTVGQMGFGWAEVTYYNDLMHPKGSQWVKIDQIDEVTWRNGRAEADTFLLALTNQRL